jgi:hypothetical protein
VLGTLLTWPQATRVSRAGFFLAAGHHVCKQLHCCFCYSFVHLYLFLQHAKEEALQVLLNVTDMLAT